MKTTHNYKQVMVNSNEPANRKETKMKTEIEKLKKQYEDTIKKCDDIETNAETDAGIKTLFAGYNEDLTLLETTYNLWHNAVLAAQQLLELR